MNIKHCLSHKTEFIVLVLFKILYCLKTPNFKVCFLFMQIPAFYLFCRRSSNKINEKSQRGKMDISTLENSLILMGTGHFHNKGFLM